MSRATLLRLSILLLLAGAGILAVFVFPVNLWLTQLLAWIESLGPWGPVLLAGVYIPATVLLIPGSLLTIGAGAAFGVVVATAAVSVGSTLGAGAAFLLGRTLARGWVESKVAGNARFAALDQAIGEQGFKIVFLLRLSPVIPFTLLNYALGLTRVRFRTYLLASWIGMMPGTLLYVYLGSALGTLWTRGSQPVEQVFFWAGLVVTLVVTIFITRTARKALAAVVPQTTEPPASAAERGASAP